MGDWNVNIDYDLREYAEHFYDTDKDVITEEEYDFEITAEDLHDYMYGI